MIFFNNEKIYYNCLVFLYKDYGYKTSYIDKDKGLLYSKIILEKKNSPKLIIEIEKAHLEINMFIGEEEWSLSLLYKYLHHNEVVRASYGNSDVIKKYFENCTRKYLDDVLRNLDKLTNDDLEKFYNEFPPYVFFWI